MTAHLSQLVSSGSRWVTILVSLLKARRRFSWIGDRSGASVIIFAVALPAAVGVTGLGVEVSNWYPTQRGMQNAADAAVLAASANGGASYGAEAQAVANAYGFVNGSNNVVVTALTVPRAPRAAATAIVSISPARLLSFYPAFSVLQATPPSMVSRITLSMDQRSGD